MLDHADWTAIWISIRVSCWALVWITPPGLALGWLFARRSFPGKSLLEALVHVPLVLPPIVTGYLLLLGLGRRSWLGQLWAEVFGQGLAFSFSAAVLAAAVVSLPLLVRSFRLGVELVDPGLEAAAATLGANPLRVFFSVTFPLAWPGLVTGLTLAFARGLGEFGATLIFAGNLEGQTRTIPLAIYNYLQLPDGESHVWVLVGLSILLSLAALMGSEWFAQRHKRRLGGRG